MAKNSSVLLVEDEPALAMLVIENLEQNGYNVQHANQGDTALKIFHAQKPDLIILDVMLPKTDGFAVAKSIRNTDRTTPIIFLTAKIKSSDVVRGFEAGGNDYLRKPFAMEELLIRMQALLSQERLAQVFHKTDQVEFTIGDYAFHSKRLQLVHHTGQTTKLTTREAELLRLLCENSNQLITKSSILLKIWGDDTFDNSRSMDVFISRLRKYLRLDPSISIINHRGVGYQLITD